MNSVSQSSDLVIPPVAVIDIGSNSIRLVVYEGAVRAPIAIFNEKILCGLGQDLNETGLLDADGVERALQAIPRFIEIAQGMKVAWIEVLATAAVREAENGPEFVSRLEESCNITINILTGREEARLAGLGVLAGTPEAEGIAGDLGGGSVELVRVSPDAVGDKETLPLGPLRLGHLLTDGRDGLEAYIEEHLDTVDWLKGACGQGAFYVVGGAWRNIAKIHMAAVDYPLHVIHHYAVPRDEMLAFTDKLSRLTVDEARKLEGGSKRRSETLPYAALLLNKVIAKLQPEEVVFSANGVREGCVFERVSEELQREDPLLAACQRMPWSRTIGRVEGDLLAHWIEVVFNGVDDRHKRLQHAACLLSEVGRLEHPDYRVDHALTRVMRFQFVGIDHVERAFLALAVASRYGKTIGAARSRSSVEQLLSKEEKALARATGFAIRLGFAISGGVSRNLKLYHLERDGDHLRLVADSKKRQMMGEVVERRLATLAEALECSWSIEC